MTSSRNATQLASCIDHTLLKPEASQAQVDQLCREACEYSFAAVCVNPVWVERCAANVRRLGRADSKRPLICSVVGFPLGASTPAIKSAESRLAVEQGALEIDMVVNLAAVIAGDAQTVISDIAGVVDASRNADPRAMVKVILETRALTNEQIALACRCAVKAQAHFVKTSTGFHAAGGATVEHVRLMREHAPGLQVKASGGIRDLPAALAMLDAGADRLGMSASVAVMQALSGA